MKRIGSALVLGLLGLTTSCKNFLDVNKNPNAPESVSANLYLAPMVQALITSPQYDGRFVGRYTQEWFVANAQTVISTWDRMGYDPGSDNGGQQWRDVYWTLGQNLVDMINKSEAEQRWDVAGVGYFMKAWGWMVLTDLHGEIIVKEAPDPTRSTFDYDTQEFAYSEVLRLVALSIKDLQRTDGAVDPIYLGKTDKLYNGDRTKWLKMAYGLQALALNHFSNKSTYKPADVIASVNSSFASNADDAIFAYPGNDPASSDYNFWGSRRGNINNYRQTQFVVGLMNGTVFGAVDPRMSRMLAVSPDGQYRGVDPTVPGYGAMTAAQQPNNFWGYSGGTGVATPEPVHLRRPLEVSLHDVRAVAVREGGGGVPVGRQGDGARCVHRGNQSRISTSSTPRTRRSPRRRPRRSARRNAPRSLPIRASCRRAPRSSR